MVFNHEVTRRVLYPKIISNPLNELVILPESADGFHRGLKQDPTENKDSYGESDLPWPRRLWAQPNQGQRQRPHTTDCHDDKRLSEIPLSLFLCKAWVAGGIQDLTAVLTLYRLVLNVFSAEGTFFHQHLSWSIPNTLSSTLLCTKLKLVYKKHVYRHMRSFVLRGLFECCCCS